MAISGATFFCFWLWLGIQCNTVQCIATLILRLSSFPETNACVVPCPSRRLVFSSGIIRNVFSPPHSLYIGIAHRTLVFHSLMIPTNHGHGSLCPGNIITPFISIWPEPDTNTSSFLTVDFSLVTA